MIPRQAAARIHRLLQGFPIVTVTGPRQSGKTTLVRSLLPGRPYVSLESPVEREFAQQRPAEFLRRFDAGAVIDEAQHAPQLFSQLQVVVDERRVPGQFLLTGSQNLSLVQNIGQSLAGRTALVELPPLSLAELRAAGVTVADASPFLCKGFFRPCIHAMSTRTNGCRATLSPTPSVTRASCLLSKDLGAFQRFLVLTAARTGQQLNMQSLANDVGVSDKTVKHWLSILETCYLVHFLRPHLAHYGKRLSKMPKLYMTDVGLAAALLGIRTAEKAQAHPLRGALFETMVVNEFLKARSNGGERPMLCYWRDHLGTEVDLVLERGSDIAGVEIKSGISYSGDSLASLRRWHQYATQRGHAGAVHLGLVYGGSESYVRDGVNVLSRAEL